MKSGFSSDRPKTGFPFSNIPAKVELMKIGHLPWMLALSALTLSACGLFKSEKAEESDNKPKTEAPSLVGRIASIPPDKRFVLIQSYGGWKIESGTILTTRGPEERTANLLVTGESLGHFAAADLQSGAVEVGDAVYSQHSPVPVQSTSNPAGITQVTEIQEKTAPENVQKNN